MSAGGLHAGCRELLDGADVRRANPPRFVAGPVAVGYGARLYDLQGRVVVRDRLAA